MAYSCFSHSHESWFNLLLSIRRNCFRSQPKQGRKLGSLSKVLAMAEVSVICKRTVVANNVVEPGKLYSLSALDLTMESNNLRIVFYYRFPSEGEFGTRTRKLRESISEVLSSFPVVTGRLQRTPGGRWMIKCNDAGVRMIEARARGSVEGWLQTADREQELKLIHWEEMLQKPYFWSTFYVQLTEFEGGGVAIGLSCSHLLADAACATMLIKAWADTTFTGKMLTPPHFHNLPSRKVGKRGINHQPYTEMINHYKTLKARTKPIDPSNTKAYSTVTLSFTDEMVRRCTAMAGSATSDGNLSPSPFEALAALFWVCISNLKGKGEGLMELSLCLDMRTVLGLDKGFFGNCMVFNKVSGVDLDALGVVKAARAIGQVVKKMTHQGVMDLFEWLDTEAHSGEECSDPIPPLPPINGPELICANWENLASYSAIFESEFEPLRVSYYLEPAFGQGQVLILPASKGEGSLSRAVMVTLPKEEALQLCEDALILRFSPTILMGVKKRQA